jgi:NADPH-dependent 2,4-dienoyl-CoA reductase/sulfur reductase-like enzyme
MEFHAVGAICPHHGAPLADGLVTDGRIRCPWHHAEFDLRTGAVTRPPALGPLTAYAVRSERGRITVTDRTTDTVPAPLRRPTRPRPASVVVIGAGAAGASAVGQLREDGYDGPITIVDPVASEPIDRPNLSKDFLAGRAPAQWLPLRDENYWRQLEVTRRLDTIRRIDTVARTVGLGGGLTLSYDRLLLAPGSRPFRLAIPSARQEHVYTLRTFEDARAIIAAVERARHVAVIGSSFIGMETAAALRARGLEVTVISPDKVPFQRTLGLELGARIRERFEQHGVHFQLGRAVERIGLKEVHLHGGGRVPAEVVVVGIGVRPRIELAQRSGIPHAEGILVDEYLETSHPGVFAAGDVAEWAEVGTGRRRRIEHWVMAQRQGKCAARNLLGDREPFTAVPFFWTNFVGMDWDMTYVGWPRAAAGAPVPRLPASGPVVTFVEEGRVHAVVTVGDDRASLAAELAFESEDELALHRIAGGL